MLIISSSNLSGVEGGPVFGGNAEFVGILIRPLRQKNSGAEIQVRCEIHVYFFAKLFHTYHHRTP